MEIWAGHALNEYASIQSRVTLILTQNAGSVFVLVASETDKYLQEEGYSLASIKL